ncbi:MAG: hypothetical protein ACK559_33665, partial [bacterium]
MHTTCTPAMLSRQMHTWAGRKAETHRKADAQLPFAFALHCAHTGLHLHQVWSREWLCVHCAIVCTAGTALHTKL